MVYTNGFIKKPLLVCRIENDYALRTYSDFKN